MAGVFLKEKSLKQDFGKKQGSGTQVKQGTMISLEKHCAIINGLFL